MSSPHVTARELARREITRSITDVARAHLAEQGAAALSLRAVARDVGMVSSAVYRYFPSRDDLLTALIVDAYDAIGEVAERAHLKAVRAGVDHGMRWLSVCRAVRSWAKRHTQEWALVYGSPVVGYAAPTETIAPAARIAQVFVTITVDAAADGALVAPSVSVISRRQASADLVTLLEVDGELAFDDLPERSVTAWIALVGAINFELYGHLNNVVSPYAAFFDSAMVVAAGAIGLEVTPDGG